MNIAAKAGVGFDSEAIDAPDITSVGVIGAGQMGNGIAHVCALAGLPVTIVDIKQDALTKAMATMSSQHGSPGQPIPDHTRRAG